MSNTWLLLALVVLGSLFVAWNIASTKNAGTTRREERERWQEQLQHASPDDLARWMREAIQAAGWRRLPAGAAILARDTGWTDLELRTQFESLWQDCMKEDEELERSLGRSSNHYQLFDTGLVQIGHELQRRAGADSERAERRG